MHGREGLPVDSEAEAREVFESVPQTNDDASDGSELPPGEALSGDVEWNGGASASAGAEPNYDANIEPVGAAVENVEWDGGQRALDIDDPGSRGEPI